MVEGQLGYVVSSYLAFGVVVLLLVLWVGVGHPMRLRRLRALEHSLSERG